MHKRVIRILCYEGTDWWMDQTLIRSKKTFYSKNGTISELYNVELKDGETLQTFLRQLCN